MIITREMCIAGRGCWSEEQVLDALGDIQQGTLEEFIALPKTAISDSHKVDFLLGDHGPLTEEQRNTVVERAVTRAIKDALEVYKEPGFVKWANAWLDGTDRSEESAWAAVRAAWTAVRAAGAAGAAGAARDAAWAAVRAAWTAVRVAAGDAAKDAEIKRQLDDIRDVCKEAENG